MRRLLMFVALLACAAGIAGPAQGIEGEQRLLVLLVTWGPEPYSRSQAEAVLAETASFVRSASFERTSIVGDVTPWLHAFDHEPAQCDVPAIMQAADGAAARAGFDTARYTKVAYAFPRVAACPWGGAYFGSGIQLNGRMDRQVFAHELGHTYGISEEGPAWVCDGGRCEQRNYESPYSVMGHGLGDYSAYEKVTFGWVEAVARPAGNGTHAIGAIDRPSYGAQALHVLVAGDEYWFEYRPPRPRWEYDEPTATPGLAVYGGPHGLDEVASRFPVRNLLLRDPIGNGRSSVGDGETFRVPGAFEVRVAAMGADRAEAAFRWLDRTRPAAPRIVAPAASTRGRNVVVRWRPPREGGSGIAAYEVRLDGRLRRTVPAVRALDRLLVAAEPETVFRGVRPGLHRVTIVAVDRAGNRSAAATRRFRSSPRS
jgi:hypothetical protein